MKKILIYQHQSSLNHGCEALAYTVSQQIKNVCSDCDITVSSFFKGDDEKFEFPNVNRFLDNKMWLRRFTFPWFVHQIDKRIFKSQKLQESVMYCKPCFEAAKHSDVCVAIGGDNYCYNKGKEHWPLERKIKKLGKKMMLWGCSVEPDGIDEEMANHLNNFDVITVRDPISYDALNASPYITSKVVRCADPAFLLEVQECPLPDGWKSGKMVGLNFSPMVMGEINNKEETRNAFCRLIDYILSKSDNNIVLIPHVRLRINDDVDELRPIYNRYRDTGRVILIDDITLNARQLKYLISNCKVFVGARTHATIAAYSTCVPTLSIGYSVKSRGIARDLFGNEDGMTVPINELASTDKLIEFYKNIYDSRDMIRQKLSDIMPEYKKKALLSGEAFKELIG